MQPVVLNQSVLQPAPVSQFTQTTTTQTYQPTIQQVQNFSQNYQQSSTFQQGLQTQTAAEYRQDPYCATFGPSGVCTRCANRYYFSNNGSCIPISGNCNSYDNRTGECTSCYPTFILQNGECYIQLSSTSQSDPNCKTYSGNICQ